MTVEQIAQWVIDNRWSKGEGELMTCTEMYHLLCDMIREYVTDEFQEAYEMNNNEPPKTD